MFVTKRNGKKELVQFDKITKRLNKLKYSNLKGVIPEEIAQKTISFLTNGIDTKKIDHITASIAQDMALENPGYGILAATICVDNLHKNTPAKFSECMTKIQETADILDDECYQFIMKNAKELDAMIIHDRDYSIDYVGFKTAEHSYLIKIPTQPSQQITASTEFVICDRLQYMYMRVAIQHFMYCDKLD